MVSQSASGAARVTPLKPHSQPAQRSWISFLEDQLPSDWLAGEWDANTGILAPLPDSGRFSVVTCSRTGCPTVLDAQRTCHSCRQNGEKPKVAATGDPKPGKALPFRGTAFSPVTESAAAAIKSAMACVGLITPCSK